MRVQDVCDQLALWAPKEIAEDFDNVGLLVGNPEAQVNGILVCHDALEEVIDEAIELGASMVVCFHPIIFSGLKKITPKHYAARSVIKAIQHSIAVYALHTALDKINGGVSDLMADALKLEQRQILMPEADHYGFGRIGLLPKRLSAKDFLTQLGQVFKSSVIKHSDLGPKSIHKVAVLGGSGAFAIEKAIEQSADAYVSAEFKYHDFFKADSGFLMADIGHYESERFTKNAIAQKLREKFPNFAVTLSELNTNPVKYYTYG
jgi:dinuclear metal center YbgI/SA1388 family protein